MQVLYTHTHGDHLCRFYCVYVSKWVMYVIVNVKEVVNGTYFALVYWNPRIPESLILSEENPILGAACGNPHIVFISTSGMLRLSDIYLYIYNTCSYT